MELGGLERPTSLVGTTPQTEPLVTYQKAPEEEAVACDMSDGIYLQPPVSTNFP